MSATPRMAEIRNGRPPRWERESDEHWLRTPRGNWRIAYPVLAGGRWFLSELLPGGNIVHLGSFSQESEARIQAEMRLTVRALRSPVAVRDHLSRHAAGWRLLAQMSGGEVVNLYDGHGRHAVEAVMGRLAPGAGLPFLGHRFWRWLQVLGYAEEVLGYTPQTVVQPYHSYLLCPLVRLLLADALADSRLLGIGIDYCADHDLAVLGEWLCTCRELILADDLPCRPTLAAGKS